MFSEAEKYLKICVSKIFFKSFRALITARKYTVKNIFLNFFVTEIC